VQPVHRVAPQMAMLEPYREQIARWLDQDHLVLTRIQELLDAQRVQVKYTTLRSSGWPEEATARDVAHGANGTRRSGRDGFRKARHPRLVRRRRCGSDSLRGNGERGGHLGLALLADKYQLVVTREVRG
jgi:hypothetical protein